MKEITIKNKASRWTVREGKPAIIKWKSKNKSRPGCSTAVGWIKQGAKPGTIDLIHSCFQTWDEVEREYPSHWTVYVSSIIDIRMLSVR